MFSNLLLGISYIFLLTATCGLLLYKTLVLQISAKNVLFWKIFKISRKNVLLMKIIYKNVTGNMLLMLVVYF